MEAERNESIDMQKQFKNSVLAVTILTLLAANTLLPCFARSAMALSKTSSASAKAPPIPNGTSAAGGIATHTSTPNKVSSSNSSTGKHSVRREVQAADEPSQPPLGRFKNIFFENDSLFFKLARTGGVFVAPLTATIDGLAFPFVAIRKSGVKLTLAGSPGGSSLGSIFPDGATAAITIINGDGLREYLVLLRRGDSVSVQSPSINGLSASHGFPGSTLTVTGTNFSSSPSDNIVIFRTGDGREFPSPVIDSTDLSVTTIVPPIPLSIDFKSFYSGSIEVRVQTAAAYASNSSSLTVDSLPNNSGPIGSVTQNYIQQLQSLQKEIEDDIASIGRSFP